MQLNPKLNYKLIQLTLKINSSVKFFLLKIKTFNSIIKTKNIKLFSTPFLLPSKITKDFLKENPFFAIKYSLFHQMDNKVCSISNSFQRILKTMIFKFHSEFMVLNKKLLSLWIFRLNVTLLTLSYMLNQEPLNLILK